MNGHSPYLLILLALLALAVSRILAARRRKLDRAGKRGSR
jgi:hypothetical protein